MESVVESPAGFRVGKYTPYEYGADCTWWELGGAIVLRTIRYMSCPSLAH